MKIERRSPCKINLLLNILGKRPDGFHELETVLLPVPIYDRLELGRAGQGIELTCSDPALPSDSGNLVHRAASLFLETAGIQDGLRIHLEKRLPLAAGLGGGSSNAAHTLLGLNDLFGRPLTQSKLQELAARLGSDVPFFLQNRPALATGRGECIQPLDKFRALEAVYLVLVHPGFGVSTAWVYQQLALYPQALHGQTGRAERLIRALQEDDLAAATGSIFNSLEAPVLRKYPLLRIYQEFFRDQGVLATRMSGSGSSTFALVSSRTSAENLVERFRSNFGETGWTVAVPIKFPHPEADPGSQ